MSSNLQKVAEKGKSVVLQTSGNPPEMSNFTQKCARLSQLLRESGMLGPPAPTVSTAPEKSTAEAGGATTTMDLLPNIGKSGESSKQSQTVAAAATPSLPPRPPPPPTTTASSSIKPEDFVKQFTKSIASDSVTRTPAPKVADKTGQMTIFYAGKVWVLDEFPEEKAREIIVLATRGSSNKKPDGLPSPSTDGKLNSGSSSATPKTSTSNTFSVPKPISTQEKLPHQPQIHGCDMPIARRASLHRFLGKRKERYTAKDPCPENNNNNGNNSSTQNSSREHGNRSIDLEAEPSITDKNDSEEAQPSKHLDLNLDCTQ